MSSLYRSSRKSQKQEENVIVVENNSMSVQGVRVSEMRRCGHRIEYIPQQSIAVPGPSQSQLAREQH